MNRKASKTEGFPYTNSTNCYVEIREGGIIEQLDHNSRYAVESELKEAYERAREGKSKLYCAWPGNYRTDLFEVDDLDKFADAFGFEYEGACTHPLTWSVSDYDTGKAQSIYVDIKLKCKCKIDDLHAFAPFALKHLGWDVSVSKGYSGLGPEYSIPVKKYSIKYRSGELTKAGKLKNTKI